VNRLTIFCFALLCGAAHAQPAAWRASHPTGQGELLLLGSIHVLRQEDYPLPPLVDRLYSEADTIVMELDLDAIDPLSMQTGLMSAAIIDGGETLRALLRPELYELAERQAGELGVPISMLENFEPWFVAITLSSLGVLKLGFQPDMGLEQYILAQAVPDGKEVIGLESLTDQVSVFDSLSATEQSALLEQTLEELRSTQAMMDELIGAWRQGELEHLADDLLDEFQRFPELYDRLVATRNAIWADRLTDMAQEPGRFLVVVGALHLVGDGNVIELLSARGFEVARIR